MRTMSGCVLSTIRWRTAVWPEGLQDRTMTKLVSVFVNRATAGWSGSDGRETDERLGYHNNCNTNEGSKCRASIGDMSLRLLYFAHVGQHSSLQLAAGKDPTAQLRV